MSAQAETAALWQMEPVQGVVFVLVRDGAVLMERCPKKAVRHGGEWFLPGGRIEPQDGGDADTALAREMQEEFGCAPLSWKQLPLVDATGGDNWGSFLMRPYWVHLWHGDIPTHCLDHPDVPLRWVPLAEALASPTYAVRAILSALPTSEFTA